MKKLFIISLFFGCVINATAGPGSFLTRWSTTTGTITLLVNHSGPGYDYNVTWTNLTSAGVGDGSISGQNGNYTITGLTNGNIYQIDITGNFPGFIFNNNATEKGKIRSIERWGNIVWYSMVYAFYGCGNLVSNATDSPDLSQVTNMSYAFSGASTFNADLSGWDVSNVTNMRYMFSGAYTFNGNIGTWNVSKVNDMSNMFNGANSFNQDLNLWDVSKVIWMWYMFENARSFNGNISNWNPSSVINMSNMFSSAYVFNQNIGNWNVSNVTDMGSMFGRASAFNQDLNSWNVAKVTDMSSMFSQAPAFNGNVSSWDVSKVINMASMFNQADAFNSDVSGWNTGNVTNMSSMFDRAPVFNQNLNAWNVSKVTSLVRMFTAATAFNGDVSSWNVGNVTAMVSLFSRASSFSGNVSSWNVSKVTSMYAVFDRATSFTGNLSTWNVGNVLDMSYMFNQNTAFNSDISMWNVSKVTNMEGMFAYASIFNQNLNTWNVSNVTNMKDMFDKAIGFDQSLSSWNVSKVTDMSYMFRNATSFNQNLNTWNVSKVTTMISMFEGTSTFNGDISNWNVGLVTDMSYMFNKAAAFNGNIGNWNVSNVTTMLAMFQQAASFNQNLSSWNVSKVNSMWAMFVSASAFNQDLNTWNVSMVGDMRSMFFNAIAFNRDLSNWNVGNVTRMDGMFNNASVFNQDLKTWNVGKVTNMDNMFNNAVAFNQNLDKWNISNVTRMIGMLNGTAISIANYDAILQGWATLDAGEIKIPTGVSLGAGGLFYTTTGQVPRTSLVTTRTWTITGDALVGSPLLPSISSFTPASGSIGTTVTITGTNFSATPANNTIQFNGTAAVVTASTATSITCNVPSGATTGKITVTVAGNTATSASDFTVTTTSPPIITSFTPASGPIGTTVTITGTNFSATPANNIVYFGATRASVTAATSTQLTVTVPKGATYQPISVEVNGSIAYSSNPFVVTFANGGVIDACAFETKKDFATGIGPQSILLGDLDGDGKADMVVTNVFDNNLSVLRNTTTGPANISYAARVNFTTGTRPAAVTMGDLDGDGKLDIAVANETSNTISVFRNTSSGVGNISFAAKIDFVTGTRPMAVSVGDFDKDGKTDLVAVNRNSSSISVFRNTSSGVGNINYATKVDFTTGTGVQSVATADFDSDGKLDVVVTNESDFTISIFRNTSSGAGNINYDTKVDFTTGPNPIWVATGDLDGDGKTDVAAVTSDNGSISLLRNTSSGVGNINYDAMIEFTTGSAYSVSISDIDGDGKLDLAAGNSTGTVSILRNISSGAGNINYGFITDFITDVSPQSVAIGDVDGDGKNDLAVANSGSDNISVLRNNVSSLPMFTSSGFTPTTGPAGTVVTITGTNFSSTPLNNTIKFNGVTALVTASSSTSITAIVPVGATTGSLSIQIGCITAISVFPFTVTAGSSIAITTQPANLSVCINDSASFTTAATGTTNITYQWQFSPNTGTFSDINNGSSYSGTTTATLSVNTANNFGAGQYRCRINGDLASETISTSATLSITNCGNNQPPVILASTTSVIIEGVVTIDLVPLISDPDSNLDLQSLQLVNNISQAGASASINSSFELTLDYGGVLFSGNDFITISVCDLLNDCIEQELAIEVVGDIIVYNAISPNTDNKNEIFYLKYIEVIPQKQNNIVSIYNRWGDVVFEVDNYNNADRVFRGISKNGKDLPSGTYFYKIEYPNGQPTKTGYLVLKR